MKKKTIAILGGIAIGVIATAAIVKILPQIKDKFKEFLDEDDFSDLDDEDLEDLEDLDEDGLFEEDDDIVNTKREFINITSKNDNDVKEETTEN